jgi:P4 family phage/plasmid primase-like protien
MQFTIFTANCTGNAVNCIYPNKVPISNPEELKAAVAYDHVCATYKDNYRSKDNFLTSDVLVMDIDNDHTDDPDEFITEEKMDDLFPDINYALVPSRNHMLPKGSLPEAPRFHVMFPIADCNNSDEYAGMKEQLHRKYPFFDDNALDAARFLYGCDVDAVVWHEGWMDIDDDLEDGSLVERRPDDEFDAPTHIGPILEGSRNNTMSHFAGRVLKKLGICDKAKEAFKERATKCEPPLSEYELETIWNSAIKFYEKVASQDGYVAPGEYNDEFGSSFLKPEDYSDIGEAKVLSRECINKLRYTSATDYITFHGDRWHEDKQKSLGTIEDFMDNQLKDAEEAIHIAEEALISIGVSAVDVRGRTKDLPKLVPVDKMGMLYGLLGADTYKKFVMKYRNYKNIINTQNAAKPMLAIDVSELDYDPELLNTPEATYDLTKGLSGGHPHDPDDLITKVTACAPGDKGKELWEDSLQLFFCKDKELISYVQEIVGMAAIGKVYAEHMIIAYGGGANGKSTFWNTIARVLGNYSGKISAEALTMNCKRNVKPEMAELKGKRLIIASELEEGTRLNTGMVKQLCSVDPIEAEKKYKDPFHFDPSHTLVLYTNHLPKVSANDDGTWRRLIVIPFNAKITGNSDIKNYSDYLYENAGPAIMAWIIEGAEIAINKGFKFTEPKVVADAINAYRDDNDWLGQFIEDHCDIDPSYEEKSSELYQQYRASCMQNGEYVRSTTDFYGCLEKAGFSRRRTRNGRMVVGLRLKEGQDFLE